MKELHLLPVGNVAPELLSWLQRELCELFRVPCALLQPALNPRPSYHAERQQYHSSELLARVQPYITEQTWRLLAVTEEDLYIPILTFVFGEAELGGRAAIVSTHRLRQEFYGLPPDQNLLARRLLTESVHELGHTLDLTHCDDYRCVMAASHAVEWIDIKEPSFCRECAARVA